MRESLILRPMKPGDVDGVYEMSGVALSETPEELEQIRSRTPEEIEQRKSRYRHFLKHDPEGAWAAADGDRIAGVALAIVREGVWVLSLFVVAEGYRDAGIGKELLDHALDYAGGCKGAMIAASTHPAAMRRYARAGFTLLPTLTATGSVKRNSLPSKLAVREGTEQDLELAADVDRTLRGAAHGPDLEFMISTGCRFLVSEHAAGKRGYAIARNGSPYIVAATDPGIAADLLWACLSESNGKVEVSWITGSQSWAVSVALEAGLALSPAGPICVRGKLGALTPYLPSGPFL